MAASRWGQRCHTGKYIHHMGANAWIRENWINFLRIGSHGVFYQKKSWSRTNSLSTCPEWIYVQCWFHLEILSYHKGLNDSKISIEYQMPDVLRFDAEFWEFELLQLHFVGFTGGQRLKGAKYIILIMLKQIYMQT